VRILREKLRHDFPDIVSQILNFDIPSPIDIQVTGRDPKGCDIATQIKTRVAQIPGAVGRVKFLLPDDNAPIIVPSDAFVFRSQGPQVVTVTNDNRIHWQKISVGRDFGTQLEVLDGLAENTKVVINPSDDLVGSSGGFPGFGFLLPRMRDQGPPREWERKILRKRNCDELRSAHSVEHEKPPV